MVSMGRAMAWGGLAGAVSCVLAFDVSLLLGVATPGAWFAVLVGAGAMGAVSLLGSLLRLRFDRAMGLTPVEKGRLTAGFWWLLCGEVRG